MEPQRLLRLLCSVLLAGALGACATTAPTSFAPTCTALIGPIKYNTFVKTSRRYSGPDLALDLKARNQVGQTLGCPLYRSPPK